MANTYLQFKDGLDGSDDHLAAEPRASADVLARAAEL